VSQLDSASSEATGSMWEAGLWRENPVFVQVLGMCPALAVSNSARNALAMGLATCAVLVLSNTVVACIRSLIPRQVRIACYILVIATFVTCIDYAIQAISLDLHRALGAFISLIVVNCLILGRAESFASKSTMSAAAIDGASMGLGFTLALFMIGAVREVAGSGSLFGISLFGPNFQPWVIMLLPSGGFFALAAWLLVFAAWKERQRPRLQPLEGRAQ